MVDFDRDRDANLSWFELTGGAAANGLTVRDYFAAKAMQALIEKFDESPAESADEAYDWADAMMRAREDGPQLKSMSVEEAFGLDK